MRNSDNSIGITELAEELYGEISPSIDLAHFKLICNSPFNHFKDGIKKDHLPDCFYLGVFKIQPTSQKIARQLAVLYTHLENDKISKEEFEYKYNKLSKRQIKNESTRRT